MKENIMINAINQDYTQLEIDLATENADLAQLQVAIMTGDTATISTLEDTLCNVVHAQLLQDLSNLGGNVSRDVYVAIYDADKNALPSTITQAELAYKNTGSDWQIPSLESDVDLAEEDPGPQS